MTDSRRVAERFIRTNYAGRPVTLAEGPFAVAALTAVTLADGRLSTATRAATLTAVVVSGGVGLYDDLYGEQQAKGFRGHLRALADRRVTSGMIKLAGVGLGAAAAAALLAQERRGRTRTASGTDTAVAEWLLDTVLIAGTANLVNLFDLRPGRALKASAAITVPTVAADGPGLAALCTTVACAAPDLAGDSMLGDCGANALGAAAGVALAQACPMPVRIAVTATVVGLTAASERMSFSSVIAGTPWLRRIDEWGRPPA